MSEQIDFESTATYQLARVAASFRSRLEGHLTQIGIHGGQVFILIELWKGDGLKQVDIAYRLNIKPPTVNKMVEGLTRLGYVTRHKMEGDKRSSRVFLTPGGINLKPKVEARWLEVETEYLSGLTDTERYVLSDLLGKLRVAYSGRPAEDEDAI